jgi:hypothetical protein
MNVVTRAVGRIEAHRVRDDERDGFSPEFAGIPRSRTIFAVVYELVGLCSETHKPTYVPQLVMSHSEPRGLVP